VVVQDPTLLDTVDVLAGLKQDGTILVNTERKAPELNLDTKARVVTVPATQIALEELGRPIMNTAIMGAFAGVSGAISLDAIERSIRHRFGEELGERNVRAAKRAYDSMKEQSE
jgi:pyruvate ferredoxin oxidoreductase gamma subunit